MGDLNLPFEPGDGGELHDQDAQPSGGVIVMAAVVPLPNDGPTPALVFRFATPTGGFYPPMVLVMHADDMRALRPLINSAIHTALESARKESKKR